jgi:hypothetical protein
MLTACLESNGLPGPRAPHSDFACIPRPNFSPTEELGKLQQIPGAGNQVNNVSSSSDFSTSYCTYCAHRDNL